MREVVGVAGVVAEVGVEAAEGGRVLPLVVAEVPLAHRVRLGGDRAPYEVREQRLVQGQRVVVAVRQDARLEAVPYVVPAREQRRSCGATRPLYVEAAELYAVVRQPVDVRRADLASGVAEVSVAEIVGYDEEEVSRLCLRRR